MDSLEVTSEPTHRRAQTYVSDQLLPYCDNQRFLNILLSRENVDIDVLENMKSIYLRLYTVYHSLTTHGFETALHILKWPISKQILDEIISALKAPNGRISIEAIDSLINVYKHILSERQLYHSNNYIEKSSYSQVYDVLHAQGSLNLRRDIHYKIDLLHRRLLEKFSNLSKAFINFDQDSDGFLDYDDFLTGVRRVNNTLQENEIHDIFKSLDIGAKGYLTFYDFGYLKSVKRDLTPTKKVNSIKQSRSTTPHGRSHNSVLRKQLPSESNNENPYGVVYNLPETMKDILDGTYQKQYLDKLSEDQRQLEIKLKNTVSRNDPTLKTIQRNEILKQKYLNRILSERKWKMPTFARIETKMKAKPFIYSGNFVSETIERS